MAIAGRILDVFTGLCVWCSRPARETGYAPGLGRELPLHPTCAMSIVYKYRRFRLGLPMRELDAVRVTRLMAAGSGTLLLGPGGACRCASPAHERPCPWPVATHLWGRGRRAKPHARCRECELTHKRGKGRGRLTTPTRRQEAP